MTVIDHLSLIWSMMARQVLSGLWTGRLVVMVPLDTHGAQQQPGEGYESSRAARSAHDAPWSGGACDVFMMLS
jgi:hypothetical protein